MGKEKVELHRHLVEIKAESKVRWEDIIERLNRRLQEHLFSTAYNNIGMFFQRQQTKPRVILDSFAHYEEFASGNCIGLTLGLIQHILNYCRNWDAIMRLPPMYVIPATLPAHYGRQEEFGHVALLVVCANGLILLDSGFHLHQGVVLNDQTEVTLKVGDKIWRFRLEQHHHSNDKIISGIIHASVDSPRFGREEYKYILRHIANPDGIILKTNMDDARQISYVRRDWQGIQTSHIRLCLHEQLIKMAVLQQEAQGYQKAELKFSDLRPQILDFYLQSYGFPELIIKQIKAIIEPYQVSSSSSIFAN